MPRANQYLLLYVLDLLSVFARKSDKNLMTAKSTSPPLPLVPPPTSASPPPPLASRFSHFAHLTPHGWLAY